MQAKGSLAETSLRSLLESAQAERATGTLTVHANGNADPVRLHFLFGHLFHAVGNGLRGDDAVLMALSSDSGEFEFDAGAKLPTDETVEGLIPDLIQRAAQTPQIQSRPAPAPPVQQPPPRPQPEMQPQRQAPPPRVQPQPVSSSNGWTPAAPPAQPPQERVSRPQPPARPGLAQGVKYRPTPPKRGAEPIPVPQGQVIYDSLKSSFVDFPRLLQTLERESYTGYVRLLTDVATGLIFFRDGQALECVYDRGEHVDQGTDALRAFHEDVTGGNGVLDVVSLSPELVDGLYQLATAQPMYTDLYASWVDSRALLEFLANRGLTGTLTVRSHGGVGVLILADGDLAGAYTSESREISDRADGVLALCDDPEAMIEVKAARAVSSHRLQLEQIVGQRMNPPGPFGGGGARQQQAPSQQDRSQPMQRQQPQPVTMQQAAPPAAPAPMQNVGIQPGGTDWEGILEDLQQATDEALGNRSRKVKDILASADRSQAGIEAAIDQIPEISILFVDTARLEQLAGELRSRLYSHLR